jgi:hypothetical protein
MMIVEVTSTMNTKQTAGVLSKRPARVGIAKRLVSFVAVVTAVTGLTASPALAAPPVPRFIPSRVTAGYTVSDSSDRTNPSSTIRYIRYLRNNENTAAVYAAAEPMQKSEWDSLAASFRSAGLRPVKIRKLKGFVDESDGVRTYFWFDKNRIITTRAINLPAKQHVAMNNSVVVSRLPDASFGMKVPAGMGLVYAGSTTGLFGSNSEIGWKNAAEDELYLDVLSVDRRAFEVYLLNPFTQYSATTVNGKPAYVIESSRYTEVWWEEQPGLLVEVVGSALTATALIDVANSVAPVDEATWQAYVATAGQAPTTAPAGGTPGGGAVGGGTAPIAPASALVGAGMVDGVPWTAEVGSSATCLKFNISGVVSETCIKAPNSLGWNVITANGKTVVVGVAAANIANVVVKAAAGPEIIRGPVGPVTGQPVLRLFVLSVPAGSTASTVGGLDAAGVEVAPAIPAGA